MFCNFYGSVVVYLRVDWLSSRMCLVYYYCMGVKLALIMYSFFVVYKYVLKSLKRTLLIQWWFYSFSTCSFQRDFIVLFELQCIFIHLNFLFKVVSIIYSFLSLSQSYHHKDFFSCQHVFSVIELYLLASFKNSFLFSQFDFSFFSDFILDDCYKTDFFNFWLYNENLFQSCR